MEAYPFQLQVAQHLLKGRSVILQAPTGAGKTRAAMLPFIEARFTRSADKFPRRCVYAVPMRVLANQFENQYKPLYTEFSSRYLSEDELQRVTELEKQKQLKLVTVQTGERAEDRQFEGEIIFTTIDQVLSNFLAIPYALGNGAANLNSAAVFGSYLVFDEFHLFPAEADGSGALGTTLEMLHWLKGITPFVLMTATFSEKMLDRLCLLLDAEKVVLSAEELQALKPQQKSRYYHALEHSLTPEAVLTRHTGRSIVICNTVKRAQTFYQALKANPDSRGITVKLLHSRFLKEDRHKKEEWARQEFGNETAKYTEKSAILVATQVIEVGLDINCENLHTELAPANSILQRAGRCARYEGNTGHVYIYPPLKEDETEAVSLVEVESGDPSWANRLDTAPYMGAEGKLLLPTWKAFASHTAESKPFSYHDELEIINEVHTDLDARLLETLADKNRTLKSTMAEVMAGPDRGKARQKAGELIRNVDNITVVVHPNPKAVLNPWDFEGFSLYRYSIQSKKFIAAALERLSALGLDEGLWTPVEIKDEAENSRRAVQYEWKKVVVDKHLRGQTLLFVHPDLATYDEELGFRFVLEGDEKSNGFQSESLSRGKSRPPAFSYNIESYKKHVGSVWKAYEKNRRDEVAWVSRRLEERLGVPQGMVDRSIRLTLACHDLGKLTEDWQDWAHDWQKRVGKLVKPEIMLAHTYYDPAIPLHVELDKKLHSNRPHHAVEGALAAHKLVYAAVGNNLVLARPIVSAVARHHSADSMAIVKHLRLSRYAAQTLQEVIDTLAKGSEWKADSSLLLENLVGGNLTEKSGLVPQGETLEQLLYFLLVRVLRLSDREAIAHS